MPASEGCAKNSPRNPRPSGALDEPEARELLRSLDAELCCPQCEEKVVALIVRVANEAAKIERERCVAALNREVSLVSPMARVVIKPFAAHVLERIGASVAPPARKRGRK